MSKRDSKFTYWNKNDDDIATYQNDKHISIDKKADSAEIIPYNTILIFLKKISIRIFISGWTGSRKMYLMWADINWSAFNKLGSKYYIYSVPVNDDYKDFNTDPYMFMTDIDHFNKSNPNVDTDMTSS